MNKIEKKSLFDQANEAWDAKKNKRAFNLFLAAAKNGEEEAFNTVGYFYDHGIGTKKDPVKAYKWYRRAALKKSLAGYLNLGVWFRESGNFRRSKLWFQKAYDLGDGSAAYELGKLYMSSRSRAGLMRAEKYLQESIESQYILECEQEDAKNLLHILQEKHMI